jgi:hypothetical protein
MLSIDKEDASFVYTLIPTVSIRSKVMLATSTRADQIMKVIAENSTEEIKPPIKSQRKIIIQSTGSIVPQ